MYKDKKNDDDLRGLGTSIKEHLHLQRENFKQIVGNLVTIEQKIRQGGRNSTITETDEAMYVELGEALAGYLTYSDEQWDELNDAWLEAILRLADMNSTDKRKRSKANLRLRKLGRSAYLLAKLTPKS